MKTTDFQKGFCHMTKHNHNNNLRPERPLGHLAAVVSHCSRGAVHTALAEAGISRRDLRLLGVLEREPQTAEALAERRARRMDERKQRYESGHDGRGHRGRRGHGGHRMRAKLHERLHDSGGAVGSRRRPTLEGKLADLEERGLIARGADGILSVTVQGAALRQTGRDSLAAVKERSIAGISEADLETTRRTLQALAHNLAGAAS